MKTLFITGAAHGIGLETAKRFAAQGWFVGLYDINQPALEELLAARTFPMPAASIVTSRNATLSQRHWRILVNIHRAGSIYWSTMPAC